MIPWNRLRAQSLAHARRLRAKFRCVPGLRAPCHVASGTFRNFRVVPVIYSGVEPIHSQRQHLSRCFQSTAAEKHIDLKTDWLEKLGRCWRTRDVDIFLMNITNSSRWRGLISRRSLEDAAAAVHELHTDATTLCRSIGSDKQLISEAIRAAIDNTATPVVSDEDAERMQRLHAAGLLSVLQSESCVDYFRSKQAFQDFQSIQNHIDTLLTGYEAARIGYEAARIKVQEREAALEGEVGLPAHYPHDMSTTTTWTADMIEGWCSKADAAGFRTVCGKTASEYIREACRVEPDDLSTRTACSVAARAVLNALQVLMHARVVTRELEVPVYEALVLCGAPESHRERALLSSIEAAMHLIGGRSTQQRNNGLLVGAKGMGKSSLFKSIGMAMAMIDFANPDVIVCPAYSVSPKGAAPLAHIAEAMHKRGILIGDDGVLPAWCDPNFRQNANGRQVALKSWIKAWENDNGKCLVPFLLLDEVADVRWKTKDVVDRFMYNLQAIAEHEHVPMVMRLTGTWSDTPNFLFNRQGAFALQKQKIPTYQLQNVSATVEAQLLCLYGDPGNDVEPGVLIAKAIAKRMLEDDQLTILRKHGFLSPYPLLGTGQSRKIYGPVVITPSDAKQWRDTVPDWKEQAMEGEQLVEILRHSAANIPRFLVRSIDDSVSDMIGDRLRNDLSSDPAFAHFAGWLLRQTVAGGHHSLRLAEKDFVESGVEVSNDIVRKSLAEAKQASDEGSVVKFLDKYNIRGHIVTEAEKPNSVAPRLVRFSSKLFLLVANAHLNHVAGQLAQIEISALHDASGVYGQDPIEGLVAEGFALNGLDTVGERVGLKGTLGFRRLDTERFMKALPFVGRKNKRVKQEAGLDRLDLKRTAGQVIPVNTILKESPDRRKADLVAICVADGSDEAVVVRAQVKMDRIPDRWLEHAKHLSRSWQRRVDGFEPVLSCLQQASNLKHIKKWTHLPVWLSAVEPSDKNEIEATGVKVVSGEAFWRMAIPAVQLTVTSLHESAPEFTDDEKHDLLSRVQRPFTYMASVEKREIRRE